MPEVLHGMRKFLTKYNGNPFLHIQDPCVYMCVHVCVQTIKTEGEKERLGMTEIQQSWQGACLSKS